MITLIVPYYRNSKMLIEQAREWIKYPQDYQIILVDDGSPEQAVDVIRDNFAGEDMHKLFERTKAYRINEDIPWNRGGARNLGVHMAETEWIVHIDIDHLLPADCAVKLVNEPVSPKFWYRFPRFRRGMADETRRKDQIADDVEFGQIHPHIDSYLCTKTLYNRVGGYDEDYSGCLGGGSPFLKRMEKKAAVKLLSKDVFLCVYTRSVIDDASDNTLSRDTAEFSRRRKLKELRHNVIPKNPLRFTWQRVL